MAEEWWSVAAPKGAGQRRPRVRQQRETMIRLRIQYQPATGFGGAALQRAKLGRLGANWRERANESLEGKDINALFDDAPTSRDSAEATPAQKLAEQRENATATDVLQLTGSAGRQRCAAMCALTAWHVQ